VELRLVRRKSQGIGREFAADRVGLCTHEQVEAAPKRIGECSDACYVSVGEGHVFLSNG
jgi:hypothetical protein